MKSIRDYFKLESKSVKASELIHEYGKDNILCLINNELLTLDDAGIELNEKDLYSYFPEHIDNLEKLIGEGELIADPWIFDNIKDEEVAIIDRVRHIGDSCIKDELGLPITQEMLDANNGVIRVYLKDEPEDYDFYEVVDDGDGKYDVTNYFMDSYDDEIGQAVVFENSDDFILFNSLEETNKYLEKCIGGRDYKIKAIEPEVEDSCVKDTIGNAYDKAMIIAEELGFEEAYEALIRAMDNDDLMENIKYIARMHDIDIDDEEEDDDIDFDDLEEDEDIEEIEE